MIWSVGKFSKRVQDLFGAGIHGLSFNIPATPRLAKILEIPMPGDTAITAT